MASWYHPSHIKKPWICPRTKMPSLMKNAAEFDGMRELTVNLQSKGTAGTASTLFVINIRIYTGEK